MAQPIFAVGMEHPIPSADYLHRKAREIALLHSTKEKKHLKI